MNDYGAIKRRLRDALGLGRRPVAVALRTTPPAGVDRCAGPIATANASRLEHHRGRRKALATG